MKKLLLAAAFAVPIITCAQTKDLEINGTIKGTMEFLILVIQMTQIQNGAL